MQLFKNFGFHDTLLLRVAKTISTEKLIQPDDAVIVAVSGGSDSIALLHILQTLKPQMFQKLGVAHLNHCIRPDEANKDAEFVYDFCQTLGIQYYIKKIDVPNYARRNKLNIEEAGRICRYDFFKTLIHSEGYTKIATGHHSDDNAELTIMFLLRGSGPMGISGMPIIRENTFIRPFLRIAQSEIKDYCVRHHLNYISDSTNNDLKHTRNRVRHHLIPYLKADFNPKVVKAINTLSEITRSEDDWMTQVAETNYANAIVKKRPNVLILSNSDLYKMHPALTRRILRIAVAELKGDLRRINHRHINAIMGLISRNRGYLKLNLPNGIFVERINNQLQFSLIQSMSEMVKGEQRINSPILFEYNVNRPEFGPVQIHITEINSYLKFSIADHKATNLMREAGQDTAFFDMDRLTFPLCIRNPKIGDRFSPLGLNGSQKLKKFFINAKIPSPTRKQIPVVESGNIIIWIAGHRCSHFSRIRSDTETLLKAEFFLA